MATSYSYELWDGKKVVGHFNASFPLCGAHVVVPEVSTLKQRYGTRVKYIKVPMATRVVSDNGVDRLIRLVLDVRKKSNRQIRVLIERGR